MSRIPASAVPHAWAGGATHPVTTPLPDGNGFTSWGESRLGTCARSALIALLSEPRLPGTPTILDVLDSTNQDRLATPERVARAAYLLASAMLAEENRLREAMAAAMPGAPTDVEAP